MEQCYFWSKVFVLLFTYGMLTEDYVLAGVCFLFAMFISDKKPMTIGMASGLLMILFYKMKVFDVSRNVFLEDSMYTFNMLEVFRVCEIGHEDTEVEGKRLVFPLYLFMPCIIFAISYMALSCVAVHHGGT